MTDAKSEETFEFGDDDPVDVPTHAGEGAQDVFTSCGPLIAERYIRGDLEIHLHFRLVEPEMADYCVVFEVSAESDSRFPDVCGDHLERVPGAALSPPVADFHVESAHQTKALVPVYAREFVEDEKVVAASVVRLQLLDSCPHFAVHRPDFVHPATARVVPAGGIAGGLLEGLSGSADGEPDGPLGCVSRALGGQSPSEVFEDASHVLQGVPDKDAQVRRRLLNNLRPEDVLASFRLFLVGDSVGFSGAEGGELVAQNFQVLARPKQLEAGTCE